MSVFWAIVVGAIALVPVWAVGRWVTRYDHPDDYADVAWNLFAGVMMIGICGLMGLMVWGLGSILISLVRR